MPPWWSRRWPGTSRSWPDRRRCRAPRTAAGRAPGSPGRPTGPAGRHRTAGPARPSPEKHCGRGKPGTGRRALALRARQGIVHGLDVEVLRQGTNLLHHVGHPLQPGQAERRVERGQGDDLGYRRLHRRDELGQLAPDVAGVAGGDLERLAHRALEGGHGLGVLLREGGAGDPARYREAGHRTGRHVDEYPVTRGGLRDRDERLDHEGGIHLVPGERLLRVGEGHHHDGVVRAGHLVRLHQDVESDRAEVDTWRRYGYLLALELRKRRDFRVLAYQQNVVVARRLRVVGHDPLVQAGNRLLLLEHADVVLIAEVHGVAEQAGRRLVGRRLGGEVDIEPLLLEEALVLGDLYGHGVRALQSADRDGGQFRRAAGAAACATAGGGA